MIRLILIVSLATALAACKEEVAVEAPKPVAMTVEAVGYYCQMDILDHEGPKAQIHVSHLDQPLWFGQVRDAIAYTRLPEETAEITAIYVHDMANAASWADPGKENWIAVKDAYFVVESRRTGGMGAPEAVPFGSAEAAADFIAEHGGQTVRLEQITDDYVLAPVDVSVVAPGASESVQ